MGFVLFVTLLPSWIEITKLTWADPGYLVGGDANPPGGGANVQICHLWERRPRIRHWLMWQVDWFWTIVSRKTNHLSRFLMKMKEIGCVPREPSPSPPSDQPMHQEMMDRDKGNSENINFDSNGLSIPLSMEICITHYISWCFNSVDIYCLLWLFIGSKFFPRTVFP